MSKIKATVDSKVFNSLKTYDLTEAYQGVSNLYQLVSKYAGVDLYPERVSDSVNCNKNRSEKTTDTVTFNMDMNVWGAIVDDLLTKFSTDVNAQRVIPLFVNSAFLDFSNFDLATEYTDTVDGGEIPLIAMVPNVSKMFYQLGVSGTNNGLDKGLYGDGTNGVNLKISAANTLAANVHSSWNSTAFEYVGYSNDFTVIETSTTATVTAGSLSVDFTPTDGAATGTAGAYGMNKVVFATASLNTALKIDLNIAKMPGVNSIFAIGFVA